MRYIMVTNWNYHWDNLSRFGERTLFTEVMLRGAMSKDKLVDGTETVFIKRKKMSGEIEKSWMGKVYDFENKPYKGSPAVWFRVKLERQMDCPGEYRDYPLGWHCESISQETTQSKITAERPQQNINDGWKEIEKEFEISKREFGKRINFVKDTFKREIIFRDIEQAYVLSKMGFNKPTVILAGGVIEELLRLFLENKGENVKNKKFEELIEICYKKEFLKEEISNLASAIRRFRNSVHLATEKTKKNTISKATASATVALIFTIVNDFQK